MKLRFKEMTRVGAAVAVLAGGVSGVQSAWAMAELENAKPHVLKGGTVHEVTGDFYTYKMPRLGALAEVLGWNIGDKTGKGQDGRCKVSGNWWLQSDGSAICTTGRLGDNRVVSKQRLKLGAMEGVGLELGQAQTLGAKEEIAHEAWLVNSTGLDQQVWVRLERSQSVTVTKTETTSLGTSTTITKDLQGSVFGFGGGGSSLSFTVTAGKSWADSKATADVITGATQPVVTVPAYSAMRVLIKMSTGKVRVPYTVDADLNWIGETEGCHSPWTRGKGFFYGHNSQKPYIDVCGWENTGYQKISNGGDLTGGAVPINEDLLGQWAVRDRPSHQRPSTNLQLGKLEKWHGGNIVKSAIVNYYQPVRAHVKGFFEFNHAFQSDVVLSEVDAPPGDSRLIAQDSRTGVSMRMRPQDLKEFSNFGKIGFEKNPPTITPPPPPVQPLKVGINRVAGDDVLSQGEYRARYTMITGTHSGADKVVLRYQNGYSRGAAVYKNGTWAVWLNDADLKAMGKGTERLTVTATAPNKSGTATRNIRVDAVPPVQPLKVGINRVAGDDVLSQGEYRARYTMITGTHSGADKVVLRYQNGYSRGAAVYKNGTWAVWLNDADLRAMGKGAERLTVTATAPSKLGTATRNIRVDAVPSGLTLMPASAGVRR